MTETQDNKPVVKEDLERVGITNLRTIVIINWKGMEYRFIPEIEITVDLDKSRKGAHMSRLVESVAELIESEVGLRHNSIEEFGKSVLERLGEKHAYKKAEIWMRTELVIPRKTPVTGKQTMEVHNVEIGVSSNNMIFQRKIIASKALLSNKNCEKTLRVHVIGNTLCPHAMIKNKGKSHMQRAEGMLELKTEYGNRIELEGMIDIVENSFSSEVYSLLKTEDEIHIVDKMFKNPKFVEDVTREILHRAKRKFRNCRIRARTISYESIHRHDVIAEGSCRS